MKRGFIFALLLLVSLAVATIFAQEIGLLGRYDDARYIEQPKQDTNQIVFARLIYNGRIPGYYKNWYTDYPKADRQLIMGLKRLTNLNIADYERAVAINDPDLFRYPFIYTSEPEQMVLTEQDAAIMPISTVSRSRISPTRITFGAWRRAARRPAAKVLKSFPISL